MMTKTSKAYVGALLAGGALLAAPATADASTIDCTTLAHPVYIAGGSAAQPHLLQLASALKTLGSPISLIFAEPTACIGLEDVTATTPQTESSTAYYLDPATTPAAAVQCTGSGSNPYPPIYIDIGVSGAYPSSCLDPTITLGTAYKDFEGPIGVYEIAVPYKSNQFSINYDAAYVVFGYGATGKYTVTPWTTLADIWTRGDTSAVQLVIADAIGLLGSNWLYNTGTPGTTQVLSKESLMVAAIATSTDADATIGILSSAALDPVKNATGNVKPLAFQAKNQDCGYYADSNLGTFDKINVRQGRYDIWGPEHFVTAVTGGTPQPNPHTSANPVASKQADVAAVIDAITHTGYTGAKLQTLVEAESNAFFIPECAMQVSRTAEDGVEASYQPTNACGCYFESLTGGGSTLSSYCTTCTTSATCKTAPYTSCNFGYCEAP